MHALLLTINNGYIDRFTIQLISLRANGHILPDVASIHFQTNRGNDSH